LLNELGLNVTLYSVSPEVANSPSSAPTSQAITSSQTDLLEPLIPTPSVVDEKVHDRESDPSQRVWRIVPNTNQPNAPAWVVGKLVHESLRRWHFPEHDEPHAPDSEFDTFLRPFALESGLTDPGEIRAALRETRRLLERFRAHPLFAELDSAKRYHEIPYYTSARRGIIDLLYHTGDSWMIIDFKTDRADSEEQARAIIQQNGYKIQIMRYVQAIKDQMEIIPRSRLVFLNVNGHPVVFDL